MTPEPAERQPRLPMVLLVGILEVAGVLLICAALVVLFGWPVALLAFGVAVLVFGVALDAREAQ